MVKWVNKMKNWFLNRNKQKDTATDKAKLDAELDLCVEKWKKTGYLEGLKDGYHVRQMALILENQSLFKEIANDSALNDFQIPLVYEIFKNFIGFDIVSIQTILGPTGFYYNYKFTKDETKAPGDDDYITLAIRSEEVAAKTRKLKTPMEELTKDNISSLAKSIREEIGREVFTDLRNNAGTIGKIKDNENPTGEELFCKMAEVSGVIYRKTLAGHNGDWIVTSKEVAQKLASYTYLGEKNKPIEDGIYYWGDLNSKWKLIVDTLYPPDQMLIGKYFHYRAGYIYCPYVPITAAPVINTPDFCPRPGYLTRYAKKLEREGAKFYANLMWGEAVKKYDAKLELLKQ